MLRVELSHARPGMSLALPVQNPQAPARALLHVGYELTGEVIAKLKQLRLRSVWVKYPGLAAIEQFVHPETVQKQAALVNQVAESFTDMQQGSTAKLRYDEYAAAIGDLIDHLVGNPRAAVFLGDIAAEDGGLMRHSSAVAYLALLMGLKLEGYIVRERKHIDPARAKELGNLGLGAMLHDAGLTLLPPAAREQYQRTGDEADLDYREHTTLGYRMVHGQIDATAANVLLHHHQRFDGSGWTGREFPVLDNRRIHVFSRIAAVADAFDDLRHPIGQPPKPQVRAMRLLLEDANASRFDPRAIAALIAVAPPYPPGTTVKLSNGRFAVCIDHDREHPCRPTVQFIPDPARLSFLDNDPGEILNLADAPEELFIVQADGCDVRRDNFALPGRYLESAAAAWS